ncbi:MAG: lauroyl acyltransferase [Sphingobacteriales bacterium]|nr:MAG: lauroyl acyltransferase [Sphingobacteriales bacterium]TAF83898.1 MAG: lauroyl acyltransferase [Sphingobacteriales bacterium]
MLQKIFTRIFILLLTCISYLPFRMLYILSDFLFLILYYVLKYRKKVVDDNLAACFPNKTVDERHLIAKQFFAFLADLIIESIKMISISAEEAKKRFAIVNPQLLENYVNQGRNVIVVAGHYGNWEMANVVGFVSDKKKLVIYKPLSNKLFEDFLNRVRSKFSAIMVPMKMVMRTLVKLKNEPTISFFLSDQTPVSHEANYFTKFLNQHTAVFLGVEKIAKTTNGVVVFCDVKPIKRGYYQCNFVTLIDEPRLTSEFEITQIHTSYLEKIIKDKPQYWLWSHKRWKF